MVRTVSSPTFCISSPDAGLLWFCLLLPVHCNWSLSPCPFKIIILSQNIECSGACMYPLNDKHQTTWTSSKWQETSICIIFVTFMWLKVLQPSQMISVMSLDVEAQSFLESWSYELVLVHHSIGMDHWINFDNCAVGYVEHLAKQAIKITLHTNDLYKTNGFTFRTVFRLCNILEKQKLEEIRMRERTHYRNKAIFRHLQKGNFNLELQVKQ
jgi:hypothetical protein